MTIEALGDHKAAYALDALQRVAKLEGPLQDDAALEAWMRKTGSTVHHLVGTCRMGADEGAVVDARLRVRGVEGLRVVDASIMPTITTGNTNAPTLMIGARAAALVMEDNAK